ncbi:MULTISPECIES: substrate-binding periplasmic protein [Roseateles]|uniref:Transporter substrate-binding domain-containing protein n=1 Tax=Pelomonas caseinilytica TaxID=2906763 RepID=A0ABS8XNF5_9BURK|nr:transporter substrate-binding domain-containing protein [Roseateles sp.]MCE4540126.1 transporter substrate-binding domain-containing protein [Pelomonas sp. P7]HEV6965101.1 transporter substrate-binding domain-containing protein [Roseateles sp.]
MKRRHCLALIGLTGLPVQAALAAPAPGRLLGVTENLPPLNYLEDQRPQGFSVELLRLMAREAGLDLDLEVLPWQRAMQLAESRRDSILFSLTRSPEREAQFQWVGPIAQRRILIYKLASRTDLALTQLAELGDARIGVVRDSATDRALQAAGLRPGIELEQGLDDPTNVRKLLAGRMEYITLLDWAAAWHLRQLHLPYATLQVVMEHDVGKSYWYGLRPDADPAVVRRLQAALDTLRRDGRYEALKRRYFR